MSQLDNLRRLDRRSHSAVDTRRRVDCVGGGDEIATHRQWVDSLLPLQQPHAATTRIDEFNPAAAAGDVVCLQPAPPPLSYVAMEICIVRHKECRTEEAIAAPPGGNGDARGRSCATGDKTIIGGTDNLHTEIAPEARSWLEVPFFPSQERQFDRSPEGDRLLQTFYPGGNAAISIGQWLAQDGASFAHNYFKWRPDHTDVCEGLPERRRPIFQRPAGRNDVLTACWMLLGVAIRPNVPWLS